MFPSGSMSSSGLGDQSGAQIFGNINSLFNAMGSNMFGGGGGGGGSSSGSAFSTPGTPLNTGSNLTNDIYSGFGYMSGLGQPLYNFGGQLAGMTPGLLQGGLGLTGQGFGTVGQGVSTLGTPLNFYQQLMSGNPTATAAALGPTAANINQIYSGAMNNATQGQPVGGYRAATMAGLPQAQAAQVGNAALALQPAAAQGLQSIAGQLGQLGGEQAQIGQGVSNLGLGVGGLGLNFANAGMGAIGQALQNELRKQQLNYNQPSTLQSILSSLGTLGGIAGDVSGMGLFGGGGGGLGGTSSMGSLSGIGSFGGGLPIDAAPPL